MLRICVLSFALASLVITEAAARCNWCGCRGGPGYRAPNGKCVGHKALKRVCGDPPTLRCTYEGGGMGLANMTEKAIPDQPLSLLDEEGEPAESEQAKR